MEEQKENNDIGEKLGEKKKEMIIELKDTDVIDRFFTHFKLDAPAYLLEAIKNFKKAQDLDTEENLKLALTKAVVECQEPIKQLDDLFDPVVAACGEMSYGLQFDQELAEIIGQEEPTQSLDSSSDQDS